MAVEFLKPYYVSSKIRMGREYDGGYVLELNSLKDVDIIYSYGVGWEVSFEKDLHKHTKKPSRIFDPTMFDWNNIPRYKKEGLFILFKFFAKVIFWKVFYMPYMYLMRYQIHFYNEGLSVQRKGKYDSFPNHLKRFGDEGKKIFLKIDIEGGEYEAFKDRKFLDALQNVVQIAIEFHDIDLRLNELQTILESLAVRFSVVHFHGNNYGGVFKVDGKEVPRAIELTLLNNSYLNNKVYDNASFPLANLDRANMKTLPDIKISEIFS